MDGKKGDLKRTLNVAKRCSTEEQQLMRLWELNLCRTSQLCSQRLTPYGTLRKTTEIHPSSAVASTQLLS